MAYVIKTKKVKGKLKKDPTPTEFGDLIFVTDEGPVDLQSGAQINTVYMDLEAALNNFSKKAVVEAIMGREVDASMEVEYYDWEE